ncbi:hypothetical protein N008_05070 [Hymenobacter sp. APR13]|nr:hypothetical protein N008_05070 [Hymenobacter sp. APR13]
MPVLTQAGPAGWGRGGPGRLGPNLRGPASAAYSRPQQRQPTQPPKPDHRAG